MPIDLAEYTLRKRRYLKLNGLVCLYVLADESGKPCRTGFTFDLGSRVAALQAGNARPLLVHFALWTPGKPVAIRIDHAARSRLTGQGKRNGVWFDVAATEAAATIKSLATEFYPRASLLEHAQMIENLRSRGIDRGDVKKIA